MPPDLPAPGSAADWLRYASSDLALAREEQPAAVLNETLCFHAQQAAEKAVKAVLVAYRQPAQRTHNLRKLLDALPEAVIVPEEVDAAAGLTNYAVQVRYPATQESVTKEELREAVRLAEEVVAWAHALVEKRAG